MRNFLYLAFAGLLFQACSAAKYSGENAWKKDAYMADSLLAGIERGPCFGACPIYKALIYKSGRIEYGGAKSVRLIGTWSAQLTPAQLSNLVATIREPNLEASDDTVIVNKHLADFPGYSLWISDRKPTRHIWVMHEAPPAALTTVATKIDQLLNSESLDWKPYGDQE